MIISKREVVFRFFLMNPSGESHLREISRRTGVSLPWVRKAILEFARQGLVSVRRQGSLVLVKASRDNPRFRDLKRCANLLSLYESGLVEFLVERFARPEAIVLFGSFSKGDDVETSDIDIAIFTGRGEIPETAAFSRKLGREVRIKLLPRRKMEPEFYASLINGIVLYGFLR